MGMIADILLIAGALGATVYCFVLARRLRRFSDLEAGVGGAVAVLSAQVDDMTKALKTAQASATKTSGTLNGLTTRADEAARRLELLVASLHDLPGGAKSEKADRDIVDSEEDEPPSIRFLSRRAKINEAAE